MSAKQKGQKSKPVSKPKQRPPRNEAAEAKRHQRETLALMRNEFKEHHEVSLLAMAKEGILPPLYGGDYLGEGRYEAIPIWAVLKPEEEGNVQEDTETVLAMLLLRVLPGIEPNAELQAERNDIGLENDWSIGEFVDMLAQHSNATLPLSDESKQLSMLFPLAAPQLRPIGIDYAEMSDHIADGLPFAVFPKIPVSGEGDDFSYDWEKIDEFSGDVLCGESPQLLEAMVWDYRLRLALQLEYEMIQEDGDDPAEVLPATSIPDWVGLYDAAVMGGLRFYGSTSALREKQQELDILSEENGDLVVPVPLKVGVEPVMPLAETREEINKNMPPNLPELYAFKFPGDSPLVQNIWPQLRAHNYYCLRTRQGQISLGKNGQAQLDGYSDDPALEWTMADSLDSLYELVHLTTLYEMLAVMGMMKGKMRLMDDFSSGQE